MLIRNSSDCLFWYFWYPLTFNEEILSDNTSEPRGCGVLGDWNSVSGISYGGHWLKTNDQMSPIREIIFLCLKRVFFIWRKRIVKSGLYKTIYHWNWMIYKSSRSDVFSKMTALKISKYWTTAFVLTRNTVQHFTQVFNIFWMGQLFFSVEAAKNIKLAGSWPWEIKVTISRMFTKYFLWSKSSFHHHSTMPWVVTKLSKPKT